MGEIVKNQEMIYIVKGFERRRVERMKNIQGEISGWEEEEKREEMID